MLWLKTAQRQAWGENTAFMSNVDERWQFDDLDAKNNCDAVCRTHIYKNIDQSYV